MIWQSDPDREHTAFTILPHTRDVPSEYVCSTSHVGLGKIRIFNEADD